MRRIIVRVITSIKARIFLNTIQVTIGARNLVPSGWERFNTGIMGRTLHSPLGPLFHFLF